MTFLSHRNLLCPFCLHALRPARQERACPQCRRPIPPVYLREARELQPLPIQAIGWSSHGKSVYLAALTLLLTRMGVVWPGYCWASGSDETQRSVEMVNRHLDEGTLPPSTPLGTDQASLLLMRGMERWDGRALVYCDCAGELFDGMSIPVDQVLFLLQARTTFLIVSPEDLMAQRQRTVDMLLNGFRSTLESNRIDPARERRRVVVVLTKGDLLVDLPASLYRYLVDDRCWRALDQRAADWAFTGVAIDRYLEGMRRVDGEIRDWVMTDPGGRNLVKLAADAELDLRFSIVSATGGPVLDGRLEDRWHPRRVIDPLIWALEFSSSRFRITDDAAAHPRSRPRFTIQSRQRSKRLP